jgi:hypothetical protein
MEFLKQYLDRSYHQKKREIRFPSCGIVARPRREMQGLLGDHKKIEKITSEMMM